MPISVTPTLSSTSGYLVDVRDQVMHFLKFFIMNPGGTSEIWEGSLLSFRYLSSVHEASRQELCGNIEQLINRYLTSKFTDYMFDCSVNTSDYDEPDTGRYTVSFRIAIEKPGETTFESAFIIGDIEVDSKTNEIKLNFANSTDTATLE